MPTLNFTDGMSINTSGPYRIITKSDGLYVVGKGFLCAVDTREEGMDLIKEMTPRDPLVRIEKE
jgi:hypothetical protein